MRRGKSHRRGSAAALPLPLLLLLTSCQTLPGIYDSEGLPPHLARLYEQGITFIQVSVGNLPPALLETALSYQESQIVHSSVKELLIINPEFILDHGLAGVLEGDVKADGGILLRHSLPAGLLGELAVFDQLFPGGAQWRELAPGLLLVHAADRPPSPKLVDEIITTEQTSPAPLPTSPALAISGQPLALAFLNEGTYWKLSGLELPEAGLLETGLFALSEGEAMFRFSAALFGGRPSRIRALGAALRIALLRQLEEMFPGRAPADYRSEVEVRTDGESLFIDDLPVSTDIFSDIIARALTPPSPRQ